VAEARDAGVVGVVVYRAQAIGVDLNQETRPFIAALGVRQEFRRRGIGTLLKTAAMLDMADQGIEGPTVSLVNRRNIPMLTLNQSRFEANVELDPDDPSDLVVTAAIEPVD
jgi:GNAT superfamily N-acetyltransferase